MSHAPFRTVAILGVGLIGASIGAAALRRGAARRVLGVGRNRRRLETARAAGCISEHAPLAEAVAEADLVVACAPVGVIAELLLEAAEHCRPGTLLTDAGSTKADLVAALHDRLPDGVEYVGGHPLAGSEKTGPEHADAQLFVDRRVVLTPTEHSTPERVAALSAWWTALGAEVFVLSPAEHDQLTAAISHAPHVVAAALAAATDRAAVPWTAGGWRDATRIAAGDATLWRDILLSNRDGVLRSLHAFGKVLTRFEEALATGDAVLLETLLTEAKAQRDAVGD